MTSLKSVAIGMAGLALAGCSAPVSDETETTPVAEPEFAPLEGITAADYALEKNHAFLTFKVGHGGGLSQYRVSFTDFDANLSFDPADPEAASLSVSINPLSVETNYPGDYKASHADSPYETWNEDLGRNPQWLNGDEFPAIEFVSTGIERSSDTAGTVTGDLTFLGQTNPVTLDVTYNGVGRAPWFGERDLIGFDASTTITRSEWGMGAYLPMIGDEVEVTFSGEFLQAE
ncbi:MAG: YceI family protein [Henriciella sp.]|nr:YceI family protein [Henriciella sp.]